MKFSTLLLHAASASSTSALFHKLPFRLNSNKAISKTDLTAPTTDATSRVSQDSFGASFLTPDAIDGVARTRRDTRKVDRRMRVARATCQNPSNYTVTNIVTFTPSAQENNASFVPYVTFDYSDTASGIVDTCAYNTSSVSLTANVTGLAARYPCDHTQAALPQVAFIWQLRNGNLSLTAIEPLPCSSGSTVFEASGSVLLPTLECTPAEGGNTCTTNQTVTGIFTSLQPRPY